MTARAAAGATLGPLLGAALPGTLSCSLLEQLMRRVAGHPDDPESSECQGGGAVATVA
jgi:hypothetical protein